MTMCDVKGVAHTDKPTTIITRLRSYLKLDRHFNVFVLLTI